MAIAAPPPTSARPPSVLARAGLLFAMRIVRTGGSIPGDRSAGHSSCFGFPPTHPGGAPAGKAILAPSAWVTSAAWPRMEETRMEETRRRMEETRRRW